MKIPEWVIDREIRRLLVFGWPDTPGTREYATRIITGVALDLECYGGKVTWECPRRSKKSTKKG